MPLDSTAFVLCCSATNFTGRWKNKTDLNMLINLFTNYSRVEAYTTISISADGSISTYSKGNGSNSSHR